MACACGKRPFACASSSAIQGRRPAMTRASAARAFTLLLYLIACREKKPAGTTGPLTTGAKIEIARPRAAYVTNNASDSVSVIDRDGDAVISVPVDIDKDAHEAPHHLAVDGTAGVAFVALAFP